MKYLVLLIAGAVSPYLFDTTLSWCAGLIVLVGLAIVFLIPVFSPSVQFSLNKLVRQVFVCVAVFIGMFVFTTLHLQQRLEQRLPLALDKVETSLSGVVRGLPQSGSDHLRFLLLVDDDLTKENHTNNYPATPHHAAQVQSVQIQSAQAQSILAGRLIQVYWHKRQSPEAGLPQVHPGEHWQLPLQLRTTRAQVNFVGTDPERWAFADGIAARGFVKAAKGQSGRQGVQQEARQVKGPVSAFDPDRWREAVLARMKLVAGDAAAFRLLAALAIADRREMDAADRQVLTATGTGHLLAISGLHIGLAAVIGYFGGRLLLVLLVAGLRLRFAISIPWLCAWLAAFSYAVLAGFGVSTQRALIMLSVATLVVLSRRKVHPASAWLVAMALVLLIDPFAPLRAGFWFSFLAVGVLLILFSPRFGEMSAWRKMLFAQIGISLIMAPLGMYFFQQSSLPGLLANLVAIPLVSFVSVPLILLGLLCMWLPGPLGGWLFDAAGLSLHWLFVFLQQLASWQPDFMIGSNTPVLISVILAMVGALMIMMPRGMPGRALGVLLLVPVFLPASNPLNRGTVEVDMLDVGQGLAILVGSHDFLMVYDTGPGNGLQGDAGWDTVSGIIQPAITRRAIAPDMIVASHADLDHAGGFNSLQENWPSAETLASLPQSTASVLPCRAGQTWDSAGMSIHVLHPSVGLPYLGNDSSCVISVIGKGFSVLLTGDISKSVERRLVEQSVTVHQLMTVPHHGSASSSSERFIGAVQPQLALNSAAANNRFDFPRTEVIERYDKAGITVLNTAVCGGLRITSAVDGRFVVRSARVERDAIWRFKADDNCP